MAVSIQIPAGYLESLPRMTEAQHAEIIHSMRVKYASFGEDETPRRDPSLFTGGGKKVEPKKPRSNPDDFDPTLSDSDY